MLTVIALLYLVIRLIIIGFLTGSSGLSAIKSIPHRDGTQFRPCQGKPHISPAVGSSPTTSSGIWCEILQKLLGPIGKVIQVDANLEEVSKGLVARVSIEIDISKPLKWSLNISKMDYSITIL